MKPECQESNTIFSLDCCLVFMYHLIMIKKIFVICWWLIIGCWLFAKPALAKDFSSFYKVTYEFDKKGNGLVTSEVSLVNHLPNLYVTQYSLSVIGSQITNIEAYDKIGPLKTKVDQKGETTIITLNFNEQIVGKDKVLSFILKYRVSDLAKKEGNLWQISLPKLANSEAVDEFYLQIKVPLEYGRLSVVNPSAFETKIQDDYYKLSFKKEDLTSFGVMATFGQYQTYDFRIIYPLKNESSSPKIEKIAIPPDTNYQTVYYNLITPEPVDVKIDDDGNWLAFYELKPKEELLIEINGNVDIFSQPKKSKISTAVNVNKDYLSNTKYWEANDKKIVELASQLKTPENIYKFVVKTLDYDYESVKKGPVRTGGINILENPKRATCSQFTDLFVTLCRAAGIPAREVVGYAYTDNPNLKQIMEQSDLLHSWSEYYDVNRNEWIMVDPTWEKTTGGLDFFNKFDMAHLAFVIHGKSDILPVPPGSFEEGGKSEKKIFVNFSEQNLPEKILSFYIEEIDPPFVYSLKRNPVDVQFKRGSGTALYASRLEMGEVRGLTGREWNFEVIPPYSKFGIQFFFSPREKFKDSNQELIFSLDENKIRYHLKVKSLLLRVSVISGLIFSIILFLLIMSIKKNSCKKVEKNVILQKGETSL